MKPRKPGKINSSNYPKVSVITPALRSDKDLKDFLASITKLNYPQKSLETIIIDNSSTFATRDTISRFPWVKLIKSKTNLGFAKAVNLGIEKSKGRYIFIGNDDLVLTPDSIKKMVIKLENDSTIGILGGKIYFKDKPKTIASHGHDFDFFLGLVKDDPRSPDIEKEPLWVDGCAMMLPRNLLYYLNGLDDKFKQTTRTKIPSQIQKKEGRATIQTHKLFDESFSPIYFEDADLCIRVKKAGLRVVYDPKIVFFHGQSRSFSSLPSSKKYFYWYKSKLRFMLYHSNPILLPVSLPIQLLAATYLILHRKAI